MVLAGQHEVLRPRGRHQLRPPRRVEEVRRQLGAELLVLEVCGITWVSNTSSLRNVTPGG